MTASTSPSAASSGVVLRPGPDGRVSSTRIGQEVVADAARVYDPALADRIARLPKWRRDYVEAFRDLLTVAASDPVAGAAMSQAGADSLIAHAGFSGAEGLTSIAAAMDAQTEPGYDTLTVRGAAMRERDLSVPYRGRRLFGDDLRRQLHTWVDAGIAEPSFATAVELVMDNPDWLDLSDVDVAVLGAGAEMGPTRSLLRWGAQVHAVDLPRQALWERLIATARATAGTLHLPIERGTLGDSLHGALRDGAIVQEDDDPAVAALAGADLLGRAPQVRTWLARLGRPMVVGNYTYADGVTHVRLSLATDAIMTDIAQRLPGSMLAYLATPTDVFMVPMEAVEESRRRWAHRGSGRLVQAPLRLARQFAPNYPDVVTMTSGRQVGVNDSLVPQQGPNYALAKRFQRWRATTLREQGHRVSLNIAPATRTASVVKNRALAAAYAGAGRFGVEVFEPATSTTLMAALLVHDLRNPDAPANPRVPLDHPLDLFIQGAHHGGLWRVAYSPRSVLGIAALLGMFESRA
jgi:hypothetical protein